MSSPVRLIKSLAITFASELPSKSGHSLYFLGFSASCMCLMKLLFNVETPYPFQSLGISFYGSCGFTVFGESEGLTLAAEYLMLQMSEVVRMQKET